MVRQRVITGVILAAVLVCVLLLFPSLVLIFFVLTVSAIAAYEWSKLCGLTNRLTTGLFVLFCIGLSVALFQIREFDRLINLFGVILWIVLAAAIINSSALNMNPLVQRICALVILPTAVFSISDLSASLENSGYWLLGMFLIVSIADIAAYATGKRFGKTKLAPRISPGKTMEGIKGGFFAVSAFGLISGTLVWKDDYSMILTWTGICILVAVFSIAGDLFISVQKRISGVKDSGKSLPGHGGVLDRIDSVLSAAPAYALCVKLLLID